MKHVLCGFIAVLAVVVFASFSNATPIVIDTDINISADDNAVVTVTGTTRLVRAIQYCSDEVNDEDGCPKNVNIPFQNNQFQLSPDGLQVKQNVFNLQYQKYDEWLWIPSSKVKLGKNLKYIRLRGGMGIQYVGPMPGK